jgi:hypothetical protein
MTALLEETNGFFSKKQDTYIYYPGGGNKGLLRIPKINAKAERPILQEIKTVPENEGFWAISTHIVLVGR